MALFTETELMDAYRDDEVAETYVEHRFESELNRLLHDCQVQTVNRWIRQTSPRSILEIAPGPGRVTRDIQTEGELTCLEYNEAMIQQGKSACSKNITWVQGNAFELPFDGTFDLVYSFRFIRHFYREDRNRLYEQVRNVLSDDGTFIFDAVNAVVSEPLRAKDPDAYPIYDKLYASVEELRRELAEAGFDVIELTPVQRWFDVQHGAQNILGPRSPWLCRRVVRALEALRRGPALEWVVTCRG